MDEEAHRLAMDEEARRLAQCARLRQVGDVIAALAHDFGQPLNIIRLAAENGLDSCGGNDAGQRAFEMIGGQAERLQARMQMLVQLCRGNGAPVNVNVGEAVQAAIDRLEPRCAVSGVAVDWRPPARRLCVRAVPARLAAVLDTLLENACDAVLHARLTRPATGIAVRCSAGDSLALTIADDGQGMAPAIAAVVQDPLEKSVAGCRPGLGLLLAAGLVAEMSGTLAIEGPAADGTGPATRDGTRVTVILPLASDQ